ncbi:NFACT family protein [Ruminococcaceae bacterium OttesenSCG-928-A11]|nr:NFACT family protein [Ruminococcaceae bacterium OttesenSCG-928-A11]
MALDAATLALTAAELESKLAEARVDKIHQPTRDEVLMLLRGRDVGSHRLLISARVGTARICVTGESYENPATPPSFCMLLRKHLNGGKLLRVRALAGDRIVFFDFQCRNEMGDLVYNTLAAELMGRYCNLVLVRKPDDLPMEALCAAQLAAAGSAEKPLPPKVVDALKRVDFEDSELRQLLPGLAYTLPPRPDNLDFITAPVADILAAARASDAPVPDALRRAVGGVGPVVCREVCHRALGSGAEKPANTLGAAEWESVQKALEDVRADWYAGGKPCLVLKEDGLPAEFSFTPLTQYLPALTLREYPGFSALLEGYYAEKDRVERLRQKSKQLRKTVANLLDRAVRKQAARTRDMADSGKSDILRQQGELLTANLHAFKRGDASVTLQSWADGSDVVIKLDPRLTPSQNAQRYFKEYKRKQTAAKMLEGLLKQSATEIAWLETVLYEVDQAQGEAAFAEIRAELKGQGYLKYYKQRDKHQKPAGFLRYRSSDGFLILVGRNNAQNEKLTLKTARGKDLWFHTKNAPGSHVVVMSEGADIPLPTQNEAAMLAVWHSSQKNGAKIPVDYTEVKNIRKTGDLPPGMVLYEHYETAYITPDPAVIEGLADAGPAEKPGKSQREGSCDESPPRQLAGKPGKPGKRAARPRPWACGRSASPGCACWIPCAGFRW